ncbi:M48 family metallopeptidase [Siphonobacter sp. SORGH_AS_0500]|uniref:M48 family metallopeptidase n=1 Tax=Siphonobacter sp. SORGH_AS_0500 TaxID=1864824 RepID=UPI0028666E39|nr:M48 family metallopeptidase [Siphonobacter sp. SORGH_AS_0500]MDR6195856.1 Zn-dependent protease with chaperone function [Siphonobacter sp. SORGH_AS_0500]
MSNQFIYPPSPKGISPTLTEPSNAYKRQVKTVTTSIITFIIVYIVLFLASIALTIACGFVGILLFSKFSYSGVFILGLGLVGFGLLTIFFLIKFMFAIKKEDTSELIEISEEDEPDLYKFIYQIAEDTKAPKPKKIFLSHNVNAAVFYDSSFWSMFFPIRKNLLIGVGLVNGLSLSELKAVLAHEFGHFSQRSMKLGSYVYQSNRVIYNMLYENESWSKTAEVISASHWAGSIAASLSTLLIRQIMSVLQFFYVSINKKQLSLSREMEFHADAVAASVAGSDITIHALRRADFAEIAFNSTLSWCSQLVDDNQKIDNIYEGQTTIIKYMVAKHNLTFSNDLPVITDQYLASHQTSRVVYKNQWASHPSQEEREENLRSINVDAVNVEDSAWNVFTNSKHWQLYFTEQLYNQVEFKSEVQIVSSQALLDKIEENEQEYALPAIFEDFYSQRLIGNFDLETEPESLRPWNSLMNQEAMLLKDRILANAKDIEVLKSIQSGEIDVISFDFDGKKYKKEGAESWIHQLTKEQEIDTAQLNQLDAEIYWYVSKHNSDESENFKQHYRNFFKVKKIKEDFLAEATKDAEFIMPFLMNSLEDTSINFNYYHEEYKKAEPGLMSQFEEFKKNGIFDGIRTEELKRSMNSFMGGEYHQLPLREMFYKVYHLLGDTINHLSYRELQAQKAALELQAQLYRKSGLMVPKKTEMEGIIL